MWMWMDVSDIISSTWPPVSLWRTDKPRRPTRCRDNCPRKRECSRKDLWRWTNRNTKSKWLLLALFLGNCQSHVCTQDKAVLFQVCSLGWGYNLGCWDWNLDWDCSLGCCNLVRRESEAEEAVEVLCENVCTLLIVVRRHVALIVALI